MGVPGSIPLILPEISSASLFKGTLVRFVYGIDFLHLQIVAKFLDSGPQQILARVN